MDHKHLTAPCGLDCFNCALYLATHNEKLRKIVAERLNISLEKAVCKGCRGEEGQIQFLNMTKPCNVYRCIMEKGHHLCHECTEFPCDYLHPCADEAAKRLHNTKVYNLCLIKKMGLEGWASEKAKHVKDQYLKGDYSRIIGGKE